MIGLMKYIQKIIFILLYLLSVGTFGMQAQFVANDDTGYITICNPESVTVDILANDQYSSLCPDPDVKIVSYSKKVGSKVDIIDNKLIYEITCSFKEATTDSVKYSISCGSISDTATVYIIINQNSFTPGIDFSNSFSATCLEENGEIIHTCTIRNNCSDSQELALGLHFYNEGVVALHEKAQIIPTGTVENLEHHNESKMQIINFRLGPNSVIHVTTKYYITEIISGKYETVIAELMGVSFDHFEKIYIPLCPGELTVSSCDPIVSAVDVAIFCASSNPVYSILQQPASGNAAIDANGIFRYTRPATISSVQNDVVQYEVTCGSNPPVPGQINLKLLPCINNPSASSTENNLCRQDSCEYNGSNPILINEVMIAPKKNNGAIYGKICDSSQGVGGEWVELYNLNQCEAVDISGYILGNASTDKAGTACSPQRGLGAGFALPSGTRIPPMGFLVLRSKNATPVDPSRLVANGGNTVEIIIDNNLNRLYLNNGGTRFWLPDQGGWLGLYDKDGVPQDAIYWGSDADICADCSPGLISGFSLPSLDGFPTSKKTNVLNFEVEQLAHAENSVKRIPDGGSWAINTLSAPTAGYCNGTCNARFTDTCNGTATVVATGGSGSYSYLWNNGRTTDAITGLCEGVYCVTITDNVTQLKKSACVAVEHKQNAPEITNLVTSRERVIFNIKGGTEPFTCTLDDEPSTSQSREQAFSNVSEGTHLLQVIDKNSCVTDRFVDVTSQCPKIIPDAFFTPNGDGVGDVWTIKNLDCYKFYTLSIYDRFGKLLKKYENDFLHWDGTYKGKRMPSTDYWFVLDLEEVNGSITGHFTLIR
jgi:gliding motility-associated-like protein